MIKRECKQCGEEFTLTDSEMKFYNEKGLNLPKRCSECRNKNKNINNNEKDNIKEPNIKKVSTNNKSKTFIKHGSEFGYSTKEEYLQGANEVVASAYSKHKKEAEDGDDIYYDTENNEIVFVSEDGYIRTYFKPTDGINYYNRQ